MKVLLDHNVPHRLIRFLMSHEVRTAEAEGWATLKNGDLLRKAESAGFEVMITGDKSISYQQNLAGRKLSLVVLSNHQWPTLKEHSDEVLAAVNRAVPGSFEKV